MAVVFELSLSFEEAIAEAEIYAGTLLGNPPSIFLGQREVTFHPPFLSQKTIHGKPHAEVSIVPKYVSHGLPHDGGKRISLTAEELSSLGEKMYTLIHGYSGFRLGLLGWDVDWLNLNELRDEWSPEIVDGAMHGLVVSCDLVNQLPKSSHFVPFDESHVWIPYHDTWVRG
jgi:hypothetical protein